MIDRKLTLGSLFDGSGGFPLGAVLTGMEPIWASEVEPFPIRVTTKRFPNMEHYGDINCVDGALIPSVDIITAGFCCQDLSVAGRRAGLSGERSGLFYQIPRIVKEMRMATDNEYPRFVVLENVPGMYTSNGGLDFLEVLNELVHIKDETLSVPKPANGRWTAAGKIMGNDFSICWRTLDAQFWGVPQRRRRCFIVLDLGGARAGEILFDEARLRGNYAPGGGAGKEAAGSAGDRAAPAGRVNYLTPWDSQRRRIVSDDGLSPTLNEADGGGGRNPGGYVMAAGGVNYVTPWDVQSRRIINDDGSAPALYGEDGGGRGYVMTGGEADCFVFLPGAASMGQKHRWDGKLAHTLGAHMGDNQQAVYYPDDGAAGALAVGNGQLNRMYMSEQAGTLDCMHDQQIVCYPEDGLTRALMARHDSSPCLDRGLNFVVYDARGNGDGEVVNTITGDHNNRITDYTAIAVHQNQVGELRTGDVANTLSTNSNSTGRNSPLVAVAPVTMLLRAGCEGGGKGALLQDDLASPLCATSNQTLFEPKVVAHGVTTKGNGDSFLSLERHTSLSVGGGQAGQGYPAVLIDDHEPAAVVPLEGNGSRPSHRGDGYGGDVAFTLNSVERHGVAYGIDRAAYNQGENAQYKPQFNAEMSATVVAKGPNAVACPSAPENKYVVRRLTPTECARLQGFPDWWCAGLETADPNETEIAFWQRVFKTDREIKGSSAKPKTRAQIVKWLQSPRTDAAEYKMWGNGVALPCVVFVLGGIAECAYTGGDS